MGKEQIILEFEVDGTINLEAKGFKGKSCVEGTKFVRDALGKAIPNSTKFKPCYFQKEVTDHGKVKAR